ncbi:cobalamin biosynthesis protein [Rhodococcus sp. 14-2483-1-1]|uniref:cobalamin biosynthesis protein n=1 Tax=Rhodococcus sp. 14-2483-1-1 TaxID=2023148 RepID=UPI000B9B737F|nr:cobalamin biosynthesis protein [Rhodococcus sp. 14-2483-1-1]OZF32027.1 cobalamin biosynthesis protein [Rhodococcus sp. 14-2483-1-1]
MWTHPRAIGLLIGYGLDRVFADPKRWHPVAGFGTTALHVERVLYRDSRTVGVIHASTLIGSAAAIGIASSRAAARMGAPVETVLVAAATWAALGGTSLSRVGGQMADCLDSDDLAGARALLPSLCGRDPESLDSDGLARAALESIAENTSDAAVGVLVWGACAGVPGILAYRASNTLDAMVGYRSEKYLRFGWAAARIDDVLNLVPARATGLATVLAAPLVHGSPVEAAKMWRRDASKHPSPNAGVAEASAAGALGLQLGGRTQYRHGVENRPTLGDGASPTARDLRRAVTLSTRVQELSVIASAILAVAIGQARIRRHRRT